MTTLSGLGAQEHPTESLASAPLYLWTRKYTVGAHRERDSKLSPLSPRSAPKWPRHQNPDPGLSAP